MVITHIWFDFSDTIARTNPVVHDQLKYTAFSEATGRPLNDELKKEFDALVDKHNNSLSDIFYSHGMEASYWSEKIATADPLALFELIDSDFPAKLAKLSTKVSVSLYSNIEVTAALLPLGIDSSLFVHILNSKIVGKPKPAPEGFRRMIELSNVPAQQILYIGDNVKKDILPAKKAGLLTGIIWSRSTEADFSFDSFEDVVELVVN